MRGTDFLMTKKTEKKLLFPHSEFPFRLEFKDNNDKITCWFSSMYYLEKHMKRLKLNKRNVNIDVREDARESKPTKSNRKTRKKN